MAAMPLRYTLLALARFIDAAIVVSDIPRLRHATLLLRRLSPCYYAPYC